MLAAHDLTKRYNGTAAVDHLSLTIKPGDVYALLGPNGAGKTTTINLFLGFTAPDAGKVTIGELDVAEAPLETKRLLAYIPEQVMLYKNLSGLENLAYFTALAGHDGYSDSDLMGFLSTAGLQAEAHSRRVGTYSKGMRQKVGIALALAKQAKALLLDEPTSGLDPSAAYEFSELLRTLSGQGVAILMATHDLFRAVDVGTRIGIMKQGRLVEELTTADLPHERLEQLYLAHMRGAEIAA
ncbi:MAG: ABC transporter ATP-binding protein [Rhodothermales bacterium]